MDKRTFNRDRILCGSQRQHYIERVPTDELLYEMEIQLYHGQHFYEAVPADRVNYRYAIGKWTLRETLQHVIDFERINESRALLLARGQHIPDQSYNVDAMASVSEANERPLSSMLVEWAHVRRSVIGLFQHMSAEMLEREGQLSGQPINALAIGYILVGHEMHHRNIYAERYLNRFDG